MNASHYDMHCTMIYLFLASYSACSNLYSFHLYFCHILPPIPLWSVLTTQDSPSKDVADCESFRFRMHDWLYWSKYTHFFSFLEPGECFCKPDLIVFCFFATQPILFQLYSSRLSLDHIFLFYHSLELFILNLASPWGPPLHLLRSHRMYTSLDFLFLF